MPLNHAKLQKDLARSFPDERWLEMLKLFLPTGVADVLQMQAITGLSRRQVNHLLARFEDLASGEILTRVPFSVPKPGVRGRPPTVYRLREGGAALLRRNGYRRARACGLADAVSIAHAKATLEIHLAARDAGLEVQTERELPYGNGQALRPDNLVKLPSGTRAIFETEQTADITLLRRIVDGLRHKAACFGQLGRRLSATVRVLFNLPHGREWDRSVQTWERATAIVSEESGGRLPFDIVAIPLQEFLTDPDWTEPPNLARWEPLFDPAQAPGFDPGSRSGASMAVSPVDPRQRPITQLPSALRRSARDDRLILLAFWQSFQEQASILGGNRPHPDPVFFDVMRIIYTASHDPHTDLLSKAAVPYASLYLLQQYLAMHPDLRKALSKAITRGSGSMRWSTSTILHRMQVIITTFLRYHGWQAGGPLQAYPELSGWDNTRTQSFAATVRIRNPELLMVPGDEIVPGKDAVQAVEEALAWVLWALFAHGEDIGLKQAIFW